MVKIIQRNEKEKNKILYNLNCDDENETFWRRSWEIITANSYFVKHQR